MYIIRNYLIVLLSLIYAKRNNEPKGVVFKLFTESRTPGNDDKEQFIGHTPDSQVMTLVDYGNATRFILKDTSNVAEKKLMTPDNTFTFTEKGWWILRKSFELEKTDDEAKQGFNIVYYAPDVWVIMRNESCLTVVDGIFRKVWCTDKNVNKFKMCKDRKCRSNGSSDPDMKFIKCALAQTVMGSFNNPAGRMGFGIGGPMGNGYSSGVDALINGLIMSRFRNGKNENDCDAIANALLNNGNDNDDYNNNSRNSYNRDNRNNYNANNRNDYNENDQNNYNGNNRNNYNRNNRNGHNRNNRNGYNENNYNGYNRNNRNGYGSNNYNSDDNYNNYNNKNNYNGFNENNNYNDEQSDCNNRNYHRRNKDDYYDHQERRIDRYRDDNCNKDNYSRYEKHIKNKEQRNRNKYDNKRRKRYNKYFDDYDSDTDTDSDSDVNNIRRSYSKIRRVPKQKYNDSIDMYPENDTFERILKLSNLHELSERARKEEQKKSSYSTIEKLYHQLYQN